MRDMRIVALSDQHGFLPEVAPCELLIVAGDVCPDLGAPSASEIDSAPQKDWFDAHARPWLTMAPAAHKVLTWGNHDWCGQAFRFNADAPSVAAMAALQIVVDAQTSIPAGRRAISVWATPWSRRFMKWAFMKSPAELTEVYAAIPEGIDILVSHQPPYGYGDSVIDRRTGDIVHLGSPELLTAIERVRPRLVICGHIHSGYGQFTHGPTTIYNVSVVNDEYCLVRPARVIDIADW